MDFYKELYKEISINTDTINNDSSNNICLITQEPLIDNYITLYCKHTFNYIPLYYELFNQQYGFLANKNTKYTIKCPYCRKITNGVLPYIPELIDKKNLYVNQPKNKVIMLNNCVYIFKSGKNKGLKCDKNCIKDFCNQHLKIINKIKDTDKLKNNNKHHKCIGISVKGIDYTNYCNFKGKIEITEELKSLALKIKTNPNNIELFRNLLLKNSKIYLFKYKNFDKYFNDDSKKFFVCGYHKNIKNILHSIDSIIE